MFDDEEEDGGVEGGIAKRRGEGVALGLAAVALALASIC